MAVNGSIAGPTEGIVGPLPAGENGIPTGGTTGQPLVKASNADFDAVWQTLGVVGGGTGRATLTSHALLVGAGTANVSLVSGGAGTLLTGTAADPAFSATPTLGVAGTTLGTLSLAGNTSGTALITPQAVAGTPTLTLPNASGTFAVSATAPLVLSATTGNLTVTASALTSSNDTNVTITLGGTPASSLLAAVSLTMGWTGTLAPTRGGTGIGTYVLGDTLYASAANTLAALAGNITTAKQYLSQTGTGTVSAAPAWATISGADITGAALTTANDTNVTLTLGGTPATSLLRAASVTAGWTGQLAVGRGGTGLGTLTAHGVLIGNGTSNVTVLAAAAAGTVLTGQGASADPSFSATPTLGVAGSTVGSVAFANLTSGSITIQPTTGALGAAVLTLPAATDTFALLAANQALTNKTYNGLTITSSTGTLTITNAKTLSVSNSLTLAGTDSTTMTFPSTSSNVLTTGNTATITKGYTLTPNNIGTVSSGTTTLDPTLGNYQYLTNNGAFTLAAPASDCAIDLLVTNGASAGVITFSGFTVGASTGSALTTTNTNKFIISTRRINGVSTYSIYALQ